MQIILWIIYVSSVLAWLFPPFRQYKTRYVFYFIALALADPLSLLFFQIIDMNLWQGHAISTSIYIILLLFGGKTKKVVIFSIIIFWIMLLFYAGASDITLHNVVAFNFFIILFIISKNFIVNIKETESINLFFVVLLLYNISGVMKVLFRLNYSNTGYLYFFLTNFFQIFIAIYFTVYNVNNAKRFHLSKDRQTV
jgi:hypothetical protein